MRWTRSNRGWKRRRTRCFEIGMTGIIERRTKPHDLSLRKILQRLFPVYGDLDRLPEIAAETKATQGAPKLTGFWAALSGLRRRDAQNPGRCPGLSSAAPLGRKSPSSCRWRISSISPEGATDGSPGQRPGFAVSHEFQPCKGDPILSDTIAFTASEISAVTARTFGNGYRSLSDIEKISRMGWKPADELNKAIGDTIGYSKSNHE